MGTVFKRVDSKGNVSFTARIRKMGFPWRTQTFKRRTDAQDWVNQEETKMCQGLYLDDSESRKRTLGEALARFLQDEPPSQNRALHIRRWIEKLGERFLIAINDVAINSAISDFRRDHKLQNSSLNRHLDSISVAMKATKRWGWTKRNPVRDAQRMKEPKGRVRFLTEAERQRLLSACKKSTYRPLHLIVVLALSTGMRKEELLSLRWQDLDLDDGIIILQKTKNGERRRVAIRSLALELMREHSKVRRIDSEFLFPGENKSPEKICHKVPRSLRHFDIRKPWQAALKESKIENFVFHDLRHSCASYLAMNGASTIEIAEVLGHKSLEVVKRYAHLAHSHTANVVERMNDSIFGAERG